MGHDRNHLRGYFAETAGKLSISVVRTIHGGCTYSVTLSRTRRVTGRNGGPAGWGKRVPTVILSGDVARCLGSHSVGPPLRLSPYRSGPISSPSRISPCLALPRLAHAYPTPPALRPYAASVHHDVHQIRESEGDDRNNVSNFKCILQAIRLCC